MKVSPIKLLLKTLFLEMERILQLQCLYLCTCTCGNSARNILHVWVKK